MTPAAGSDNLAIARSYLEAIERGATGDELADFFTGDAVQEEFSNRLSPQGARRRSWRGRKGGGR